MFLSMEEAFHGICDSRFGQTVCELVPEMFYLSDIFRNVNNMDLGVCQDGSPSGDVLLPPWCQVVDYSSYFCSEKSHSD